MNRDHILIEAEELLEKLDDENIRIFDASISDDVYRREHIPGAAYFDHGKFSVPDSPYMCTILPEAELAAQIAESGISNGSQVVVYAAGMLPYAARAWWVLRYAGHENVRILNGGLTAWKMAGGQVEQEARQYAPASFTPHFNPSMFADKEEVLACTGKEDVAVVDVLPLESYVASHIPGSICISCMDLMQGFDYFLPYDQFAQRLQEIPPHKRIITYCGGGIAATINAVAHIMTGHDNVAVYDGSLYEWLGEELPVEGTGKWEVWMQKQP